MEISEHDLYTICKALYLAALVDPVMLYASNGAAHEIPKTEEQLQAWKNEHEEYVTLAERFNRELFPELPPPIKPSATKQ